jgi:YebC/PmpR family DNA-binding regulatory protein
MAVKDGGSSIETNSKLRAVIQNAKAANMPKDNIERAIKRASDKSIGDFKEILFEGYGPSGIAIIVETASDNNNRTVANVRSYFNKYGGNLGTAGSVEFMFDRVCNFTIKTDVDLEELELDFIDFGVDEVMKDDDGDVVLYSSFENYGSIQKEIESRNIEIISSEFERIPKQMKELNEELKKEVNILIEKIEEDDDVQTVFHNMNLN